MTHHYDTMRCTLGQGRQDEGAGYALIVSVPVKTVSEANSHQHWRLRQKRAKEQREMTALVLRIRSEPFPAPPLRVTLTRIAPGRLDSDNLQGALKHVRDGVADVIGVDDRDEQAYEWVYRQERGRKGVYGVRVEIEGR